MPVLVEMTVAVDVPPLANTVMLVVAAPPDADADSGSAVSDVDAGADAELVTSAENGTVSVVLNELAADVFSVPVETTAVVLGSGLIVSVAEWDAGAELGLGSVWLSDVDAE